MKAERYIQRELKLINPLYFAIFNDKLKRWQIRKWDSVHPIRHRNWDINSSLIKTIKREDEQGNDIGYKDLTALELKLLRMGFYWARNAKKLLDDIDTHNYYLEQKALEDEEYYARWAAKDIWRHYRHQRVFLGDK